MPLKIVEVINNLKYKAGAQVFFTELCSELKKNNDVDLFVVVLYDEIEEELENKLLREGIKIFKCHKKKSMDFSASRELKKILNSIKPDIVNFHLSFLLTYFLSFGFSRQKWALVKTYHTVPSVDNRIDSFLETFYVKRRRLHLIAITKFIHEKLSQKYHNSECVSTIYNGVKLNELFNGNDKDIDFIIVANMLPVKNHKLLFLAFSDVLNKKPDCNLYCLGDGPLLEENKLLCEKIGISNSVYFTGKTSCVFPFLARSKCFVLSSNYEGHPISVLEAMSQGLQIIAPNVGGLGEIIEDGHNGFLFEPGNKEDLVDKMLRVLSMKYVEKFKINNLAKIKEFTINNCARDYVNLFLKLSYKGEEK